MSEDIIPRGWERVTLQSVLREVDIRVKEVPDDEQAGLEVLSLTKNFGLIPQAERFDKRIATDNVEKYKVVKKGWIVYNPYVIWEGAIHALRRDQAGIVSPVYPVLERLEDDDGFLDYLLRTAPLIEAYNRLCSGAVNRRRSIKLDAFWGIEVNLPSLPEQKAIAHVLRTVQQAKEATEKVIAATRQLKQSLMKHLFTYGPVPFDQADKVELKETEIGSVPVHWNIADLNQLVITDIKNGAFFKRNRFNGTVPFLNVADTYKGVTADLLKCERVDCSPKEREEYALQKNDIIYVRSSLKREGIGHCCIVENLPEAAIYDCHLMRVRVKSTLVAPKYLTYYSLSDTGKKELIARSKTTTMTTLNQKGLGSFRVPLPSIADQLAIQRILEAVDGKIDAERKHHNYLNDLFQTALHHLMTGKVRVPINTDQLTAEAV